MQILTTRPALRRADAVEETAVHNHRRTDARPGHWSKHRHLQCCERRIAALSALSQPQSIGCPLGSKLQRRSRYSCQFPKCRTSSHKCDRSKT